MIFIAIGANLAGATGMTALQTCQWAAGRLAGLHGLTCVGVSSWYESDPVPPSGQPPYVNGMAALDGATAPATLLAALHAIEAEAGRQRGALNAARTLDLDIIDYHGLVRDHPDPILPHPRAHQRAFVLYPLRDLAPGWVHPVSGEPIALLIAATAGQAIRRA